MSPDEAAAKQPDFEKGLRQAMSALERDVHVADFERLDVDVAGIVADGKRYRRLKGRKSKEYDTVAGPISVKRTVYRKRGGHGGETIGPLEMRLGLVEGRWTLSAAEVASRFVAAVPPSEASTLLSLFGGMHPSPAHLDRLPKAVSGLDHRLVHQAKLPVCSGGASQARGRRRRGGRCTFSKCMA